jgi:hypothetical protein
MILKNKLLLKKKLNIVHIKILKNKIKLIYYLLLYLINNYYYGFIKKYFIINKSIKWSLKKIKKFKIFYLSILLNKKIFNLIIKATEKQSLFCHIYDQLINNSYFFYIL